MILLLRLKGSYQFPVPRRNFPLFPLIAYKSCCPFPLNTETDSVVDKITKIINDHPFPDNPLQPTLLEHIPPVLLSRTFVEKVLGRLFSAHSNGLKALEFFRYSIHNSQDGPSLDAFEKTLHILTRMRYFDKAWELMIEMQHTNPSVLSLKSMSIMLSKIAKFHTYEETLEAFKRMETDVFVGKEFGTDEFNVLLRAFCTQREMKEARSVFNKMHSRFPPSIKTINILLLGFKESGDVAAVELFYHEVVRRGFKPNSITYNIQIDAYCKKHRFGDALRLYEEMKNANCPITQEIITTLIHGAGVARNATKARQLFDEISKSNLEPDVGAYNALISSLVKCKDLYSAIRLMDEMEENHIEHDGMTYHTMFCGMMKMMGMGGVCNLYKKMVERSFVPKTRTVVMLMKYFCENFRLDLGLNLWEYIVQKGCCPHSHALDLLVTALCSRRQWQEAFVCCKQMLERGRHMSEATHLMLQRLLQQYDEMDKLKELKRMTVKLQSSLPPSKGQVLGIPYLTDNE